MIHRRVYISRYKTFFSATCNMSPTPRKEEIDEGWSNQKVSFAPSLATHMAVAQLRPRPADALLMLLAGIIVLEREWPGTNLPTS